MFYARARSAVLPALALVLVLCSGCNELEELGIGDQMTGGEIPVDQLVQVIEESGALDCSESYAPQSSLDQASDYPNDNAGGGVPPARFDPCHPCKSEKVGAKCKLTVTCTDKQNVSKTFDDQACEVDCFVGNIQSTVPNPDCNALCQQVCPTSPRADCSCKVDSYH